VREFPEPHGQPTTDAFGPLNEFLQKYFYEPDQQAMRIVLGAIKSHYLRIGDPAWLFLVAPPGSGKTTMGIVGASGLEQVIGLSDVTEKTFLSGFYGREKPGLLEKLGTTRKEGETHITQGNAIFLAKDFTTVLTMRRERRSAILGQLREIHDGEFKRDFGTGNTKIWQGRVTIIAAVTPVLDQHYSVFTTLGERFLQVRWHRPTSPEAGEWAIEQQGHEEQIRTEGREIIQGMFVDSGQTVPALPQAMRRRIAQLAELVALARTHVQRGDFREITYVPEPEANTRISKGLAAIAKGIAALNGRQEVAEQDLQDAMRVGMDCLTENRRKLLVAALRGQSLDSVKMPRAVKGREKEALIELEVLTSSDDSELRLSERAEGLISEADLRLS
jgi:hypothetical protein